jgi:hypothetical protein
LGAVEGRRGEEGKKVLLCVGLLIANVALLDGLDPAEGGLGNANDSEFKNGRELDGGVSVFKLFR